MHVCSYCGIEYDSSESMCPACGHKLKGLVSHPEKTGETYSEKEKKIFKEEKEIIKDKPKEEKVESPKEKSSGLKSGDIKKEALYKKALLRLEKSLKKGTEKKKEKRKSVSSKKKSSGKKVFPLLNPLYFSRFSYIIWFLIGFTTLAFLSGYPSSIISWFGRSFQLLFTDNLVVEADLLNVHHVINDLNPFSGFFVLQGDVHLFIPILAGVIPLMLWLIKNRIRGISIAGNSNIFIGMAVTFVLVIFPYLALRTASFDYLFYNILLAIALCAPILDMGILLFAFKPAGFSRNQLIIVLLYNIGIPIILIFIGMAFDFISIFI